MTKVVLALVCVLGLCGSAVARLGDTRAQAEARYGLTKSEKPSPYGRPLIEGAKEITFEYEGWWIRCALVGATDGERYIIRQEYRKVWNVEVRERDGVIQIRDFERDAVLNAEGGLQRWKQTVIHERNKADLPMHLARVLSYTGKAWVRGDGALARPNISGDSLTLDLPQAWQYEAELRAIKDGRARTDAARLSADVPFQNPATPAPVLNTAPRYSPPDRNFKSRPAPPPDIPSPSTVDQQPVSPTPQEQKEDSDMPGAIALGVIGLVALVVWDLRRVRKAVRKTLFAVRGEPADLSSAGQNCAAGKRERTFRDLEWDEFELLVGEIYRRAGYKVEVSSGAGADGGIDLILRRDQEQVLVQCKNWHAAKVGVKEIREFFGVIVSETATRGIFVTAGTYTRDARDFAEGKPLELVDGNALTRLVKHAKNDPTDDLFDVALWAPFFARAATITAPTCPFCRASMIRRRGPHSTFWGCSTFPRCRGKREARRYLTS